ncbi:MAG: alpha/beta fold hydrolase [Pseudomonadota bacterium]
MSHRLKTALVAAPFAFAVAASQATPATAQAVQPASLTVEDHQVRYRSAEIDGIEIAYREAGSSDRPTVLLLHGFPTSSHMFRNLIPELAEDYHVVAPDYPGFGASAAPPAEEFDYSFDTIAELVTGLIDEIGVDRYVVYLMDYGAPVGYRMFADDPERVAGFVIQNGNAYAEGLEKFWDPLRVYWGDPSEENAAPLRAFLTLPGTIWQYTQGVQNLELISPDAYWHAQYGLDRPGNQEIQLELFYDYRTNLDLYPEWQALFRNHQPPALLVWGQNDPIFPASGAYPYRNDLEDLEFHLLDTGHFALEDFGPFIAERMLAFLDRLEF